MKETKGDFSIGKRWGMLIAMAIVFGLIAGGIMYGVNATGMRIRNENAIAETSTAEKKESGKKNTNISDTTENEVGDDSVIEVTKNALPTVVTISMWWKERPACPSVLLTRAV